VGQAQFGCIRLAAEELRQWAALKPWRLARLQASFALLPGFFKCVAWLELWIASDNSRNALYFTGVQPDQMLIKHYL
jgi:hypothetical protein